jgi:hypothetical protein
MSAADVIERLDGVRQSGQGKWVAKCPAHTDRSPSLSVRETPDGVVLIHCFAGCHVDEVLQAAGLEFSSLFPPRESHSGPVPNRLRPTLDRSPFLILDDAAHVALVLTVILSDVDRGVPVTPEVADAFARGAAVLMRLAERARRRA